MKIKKAIISIICILIITAAVPTTIADSQIKLPIPKGPTEGITNETYRYNATVIYEYEENNIYYRFCWGDGSSTRWKGPFNETFEAEGFHEWIIDGVFPVTLQTMLGTGGEISVSPELLVTIYSSDAPHIPETPWGETVLETGEEGMYMTLVKDETQDVYFQFCWGDDNNVSEWIGPYPPGVSIGHMHAWDEPGTYDVTSRVSYYENGIIYSESDALSVYVYHNHPPNIPVWHTAPSTGEVGIEQMFEVSTSDPDDEEVYYLFDWGDQTTTEWIGPYNEGDVVDIASSFHIWDEPGVYTVKVKAKDIFDSESEWSTNKTIAISYATPPAPKTPTGDTNIYVNELHSYKIPSMSPDLYYQITWGDGTSTDWVPGNSPMIFMHMWTKSGDYNVIAKASYYPDGMSPSQSNPLVVHVLVKDEVTIGEITGGLALKAEIKNIGSTDVNNIECTINVKGKKLLRSYDESFNETIDIDSNTESVLRVPGLSIRWIGKVDITVTIKYSDDEVTKTAKGIVIGPFVVMLSDNDNDVVSDDDDDDNGKSDPTIEEIKGGLGLRVTFKNNGDTSFDGEWKLKVNGKRILKEVDETIEGNLSLKIGEEITERISLSEIRWFGKVEIAVKITKGISEYSVESVNAFKLGPFIILRE